LLLVRNIVGLGQLAQPGIVGVCGFVYSGMKNVNVAEGIGGYGWLPLVSVISTGKTNACLPLKYRTCGERKAGVEDEK
jgi:hypothetical protein